MAGGFKSSRCAGGPRGSSGDVDVDGGGKGREERGIGGEKREQGEERNKAVHTRLRLSISLGCGGMWLVGRTLLDGL